MTLADDLHVGDKRQVAPAWEHGETNRPPKAQIATVIWVHPAGRYCTVRYQCGLTDTIQTVPSGRLAPPPEDEREKNKANKKVRAAIKQLNLAQTDVSVELGHRPYWLNLHLSEELPKEEQKKIIRAAERLAQKRSGR